MGEAMHYRGLPLSWYFWKPGTVIKFCKGQGKVSVRERAKIQGNVRICVVREIRKVTRLVNR